MQHVFVTGSTTVIQSTELQATDVDSEDIHLKYVLTVAPSFGLLQLKQVAGLQTLTPAGSPNSFKQFDIDQGNNFIIAIANVADWKHGCQLTFVSSGFTLKNFIWGFVGSMFSVQQ